MIAATSDDQWPLGPLLTTCDAHMVRPLNHFRLYNRKTTNSARVSAEDVSVAAGVKIPYPDGPIGGARHQHIVIVGLGGATWDGGVRRSWGNYPWRARLQTPRAYRQGPNATFVTGEGTDEVSIEGRVHMDRVVVGC